MKLNQFISRFMACLLLMLGCNELFCVPCQLEAGVIKLKQQVVIQHDLITVGDIAEIQDMDAAQAELLSQVTLSPAPAAGRDTVLTHDLIRRQLTVRGWNLSDLLIQGYSQVSVVRGEVQNVVQPGLTNQQQNQVTAKMIQLLQNYYSQAGAEWQNAQVQLDLNPQLINDLARVNPQQIQIRGPVPAYNQVLTLAIAYPAANQQFTETKILAMFKPVPRVLAVKNTLPKGYLITEQDLIYVTTDKPERGITDPKQVVGHETMRAVRAEEPIEPTFLRRNPLIRNHDIVTVYVRTPSFSIHRQFKAKSEGAMGDTIQLVTLDNKELVSARVTGFREAEVIPTGTNEVIPTAHGTQIPLHSETTQDQVFPVQQAGMYQQQNQNIPFQRFQRNQTASVEPANYSAPSTAMRPAVTSNQPLSLTR